MKNICSVQAKDYYIYLNEWRVFPSILKYTMMVAYTAIAENIKGDTIMTFGLICIILDFW